MKVKRHCVFKIPGHLSSSGIELQAAEKTRGDSMFGEKGKASGTEMQLC
jgi:hypothetical protein